MILVYWVAAMGSSFHCLAARFPWSALLEHILLNYVDVILIDLV